MTWLNPVAFLGMFALAVPILVHLFGRRTARRQVFPSLRLLRDARPTPATRRRPSDTLLLVVRCAIVVAAVAALAQPRWSTSVPSTLLPVRAVVLDTSTSMTRLTRDGSSARQQGTTLARALLDSAREGIFVETGRPGAVIGGAASWLAARSGLRELVVVSDFQSGAVMDGDFAHMPAGIGTRMIRISGGDPPLSDSVAGNARVNADSISTRAAWTVVADSGAAVAALVADAEVENARASIAAIRTMAPRPNGGGRRVAVVFPGHAGRDSMVRQAARLDSSWQGDFMLSLRRNALLASVSKGAFANPACESAGATVVRDSWDQAVATVAGAAAGYDVLVFACVDVGTVPGMALLLAAESAMTPSPLWSEMEPTIVPDELLRSWERPAVEESPHGEEDTSPDGRWLWLVAIALLLLEEWLKRRPRATRVFVPSEVERERVA